MKQVIENKSIIDIETSHRTINQYSGICLVASSEIIMFLNFDEDQLKFDGFTVLKNIDFESYREWDEEEYKIIENDNSEELIKSINLEEFTSLKHSLEYLRNKIIAIYIYEDEDSYYVGKLENICDNYIELKKASTDSVWSSIEKISFKEISYIGFDTSYERKISDSLK